MTTTLLNGVATPAVATTRVRTTRSANASCIHSPSLAPRRSPRAARLGMGRDVTGRPGHGKNHPAIKRRGDEVTRMRSLVADDRDMEDVEDVETSDEERESRKFFAAATGLFSPAVFDSSTAKRGPSCLLEDDVDELSFGRRVGGGGGGGAINTPGGGSRKALGQGVLALALGVAGFGTVGGGGRSLQMEQAANAAVVNASSSYSVAYSSTSSSSRYYSKYSKSLLPAAVTSSGVTRAHPDHIGLMPNPHFEDMICSRWFVGSMNAIG